MHAVNSVRLGLAVLFSLGVVVSAAGQEWSRTLSAQASWPVVVSVGPSGTIHVGIHAQQLRCAVLILANGQPGTSSCYEATAWPLAPLASSDGGYFAVENGIERPRNEDAVTVAKVDASGRVVWARRYNADEVLTVRTGIATRDGGLLLGGTVGQHDPRDNNPRALKRRSIAIKIARDGTVEWSTTFDVTGKESINLADETSDGFVLGLDGEGGSTAVRVDRRGELRWARPLGAWRYAFSILSLPDGSTAVSGEAERRRWVSLLDRDGRIRWERTGTAEEPLWNLHLSSDRNIVVYGGRKEGPGLAAFIFSTDGKLLAEREILGSDRHAGMTHHAGHLVLVRSDQQRKNFAIHRVDVGGNGTSCLRVISVKTETFSATTPQQIRPPIEQEVIALQTEPRSVVTAARTFALSTDCLPPPAPVTAGPSPADIPAEKQVAALKAEQDAFRASVRALFLEKRFDELERMGAELRATTPRFPDGAGKLIAFYDGIALPGPPFPSEEAHLAALEVWLRDKPNSATAAVAAVRAYFHYAWMARGREYTQLVTESASEKARRLVSRANEIIERSASFAAKDPEYHVNRVDIAALSGCDRVRKVAYEPAMRELGHGRFFRVAARYFMPRWCGTGKEYVDFAEYAARHAKNEPPEHVYAVIALDAIRSEKREDFARYHMDWLKIRGALEGAAANFPQDPSKRQDLLAVAAGFGDRAAVRALLKSNDPALIGYEKLRAWAVREPPPDSFVEVPREKLVPASRDAGAPTGWVANAAPNWPPIILESDLQLKNGSHHTGFHGFLINTARGPVAVSAAPPNVPLENLHGLLSSWTLKPPGTASPSRVSAIESVRPVEGGARGLLLALAGTARPAVRPLEVSSRNLNIGDRLYVVGCRARMKPCTQTAYEARVATGSMVTFGLQLFDEVTWRDFVGSPVIDEDGLVVGVVSGSGNAPTDAKYPEAYARVEQVVDLLKTTVSGAAPIAPSSPVRRAPAITQRPVLLTATVRLQDGREQTFNAFLLDVEGGPFLVTAKTKFDEVKDFPAEKNVLVPVDLPVLSSAKWTVTVAGQPSQVLAVQRRSISASSRSRSHVLTAQVPAGFSVQLLKPSTRTPSPGERLFVVACEIGRKPCRQTTYEAEVEGRIMHFRDPGWTVVRFDKELDWHELIGSPALDHEGNVVGVVAYGHGGIDRPNDGISGAQVEEIQLVMKLATQ